MMRLALAFDSPYLLIPNKKGTLCVPFLSGGDKGNRTPDLLNANQALYHLSYTPTCGYEIYRRLFYTIMRVL